MTDRTIRWRIIERVMGRLFRGMGNRQIDQIIMVAGFTVNDAATGLAIIYRRYNFTGNRPFVNAGWFCRQACAIDRVGVTTGTLVIMGLIETGKGGG